MSNAPVPMMTADGKPQFYDLAGSHHPENGTLLGFWVYLMSDCLIFACLFAVYGVLGRSYDVANALADAETQATIPS